MAGRVRNRLRNSTRSFLLPKENSAKGERRAPVSNKSASSQTKRTLLSRKQRETSPEPSATKRTLLSRKQRETSPEPSATKKPWANIRVPFKKPRTPTKKTAHYLLAGTQDHIKSLMSTRTGR